MLVTCDHTYVIKILLFVHIYFLDLLIFFSFFLQIKTNYYSQLHTSTCQHHSENLRIRNKINRFKYTMKHIIQGKHNNDNNSFTSHIYTCLHV